MKRISLAILLLIACSYTAKSQKNYKRALIIKAAGDTVKGYVNYKEWDENPEFIDFKYSVTDAKPNRYTPDMLRGFEVLGMDKYLSYIGNISADKSKFPDLASNLDTTTVHDTVFLQQVYKGQPLSLLKHTDNIKTRFFITEKNEAPVELMYHQFYTNSLSIQQLKLFHDYLLQLAQKYNTSKGIEARIHKADFTEADLYDIVKLINNDHVTKTSGTGGSRFYVGILFNRTTTDFVGQNPLDGQKAYSYIPTLNAGIDIFRNKYTQRFFLRADVSLSANMPHFKYQTQGIYSYEYKFKQYTASLLPQLIYNFYNKDNVKIYLGAGGGINYSVYGKDSEYIISTNYTSNAYKNQYEFDAMWFSIVFKAGAIVNKKIEIYAQYTPPANNSNYVYFSIRNSNYGLGVHYLFGK